MTGNHGTPDRASEPDRFQPNSRLPHPSQSRGAPIQGVTDYRADYRADCRADLMTAEATEPTRSIRATPRRLQSTLFQRMRLPRSWQFWAITLTIAFSGLGILSATALFRLPSLPNCPAIFWPTASASLRMYCAQLAAEKRTTRDLLRAISLVNALPDDHPLRPEINRNIEAWSQEILTLGEETFHAGDLDKAIEMARSIPKDTTAHGLVEDRITQWQTIWDKASDIYRQAEDALKAQKLRQAFQIATQLLEVGNEYWETTKYRELNTLITETRQDSNKLDKAKGLMEQGGLSNLLAALKLVEEIQPKSYLHAKAQLMIADVGRSMLDLAEAALDRRDYNEALKIAEQIPEKANLQEEVRDFNLIAESQSQAWGGTVADLEAAIVAAQRIKPDRPLYGQAQQLISRWQLEIQDVAILDRARQIAQAGTAGDLRAAIAEAQRISFGRPRQEEAEAEIDRWRSQIQTSEDQPYLDQAEQYANLGDLQAAINEASRISPGRALYDQASRRIDQWTSQIQRSQDQPQLDQARQLANAGDLAGAITMARQIGSGRVLSTEAQADIERWSQQLEEWQDQPYLEQARQLARQGNIAEAISVAEQIGASRSLYETAQAEIQQWQSQFQGQDQLQQAYNAAKMGTPAMLGAAIEIASQIASSSPAYAEADRMIDQWSYQILQIAEAQSASNLPDAITIAERIPPNSAAYATAQRNLASWRQMRRE